MTEKDKFNFLGGVTFIGMLILIGVIVGLSFQIKHQNAVIEEYENMLSDTSITARIDTVFVDSPTLIERYESQKDSLTFKISKLQAQLIKYSNQKRDTIILHDVTEVHDTTEIEITLPREVARYRDSTYYAVVSGIDPSLDTIRTFNTTTTKVVTQRVVHDYSRWSIGFFSGAMYDGKKVRPCFGAGVQYNLIRFKKKKKEK